MSAPNPMPALRALLDDHEQRYGRGDLWRAASEEMGEVDAQAEDSRRLDWLEQSDVPASDANDIVNAHRYKGKYWGSLRDAADAARKDWK